MEIYWSAERVSASQESYWESVEPHRLGGGCVSLSFPRKLLRISGTSPSRRWMRGPQLSKKVTENQWSLTVSAVDARVSVSQESYWESVEPHRLGGGCADLSFPRKLLRISGASPSRRWMRLTQLPKIVTEKQWSLSVSAVDARVSVSQESYWESVEPHRLGGGCVSLSFPRKLLRISGASPSRRWMRGSQLPKKVTEYQWNLTVSAVDARASASQESYWESVEPHRLGGGCLGMKVLLAYHEKSPEMDGRARCNFTPHSVLKTSVHLPAV
jgi:hypothetical protein